MDQDSVHIVVASKVPMLKLVTKLVEGVETTIAPVTANEKAQRRILRRDLEGMLLLKRLRGIFSSSSMKILLHLAQRNKLDIDTLSLDDLYNNLKIYEPEVKGTSSSGTNTQNVAFVSSNNTNNTNGAVNTAHGATTASTQVTDGYANNEGKEILEEDWKEVFYEWVVPVETTTSNALISCDGLGGYDWSDQAEEGPTNFALMAYSSTSSNSEVSTDPNCSSSCLESVKILKEQNEQLLKDLRTSKLRRKLELAQKQKDKIQLTIENFENSSKSLSKLLDCQIVDKCKIVLGYNVVLPPYIGNFMPPKPDLSFSGLEEFVNEPIVSEPTGKKSVVESSKVKNSADKSKAVRKNNSAPMIEDWVTDSKEEDLHQAKIEKKTVKPSLAKIKFVKSKEQVKSPRKTTKQGNQNRLNTHAPRGNKRNWNNMMSQKVRSNFEMINKACYVCGSFDHLQYDCNNYQRQFNNKKMVKPV
ncbi:hypothetical protein Tco_0718270 [Tanacetum coccineum]